MDSISVLPVKRYSPFLLNKMDSRIPFGGNRQMDFRYLVHWYMGAMSDRDQNSEDHIPGACESRHRSSALDEGSNHGRNLLSVGCIRFHIRFGPILPRPAVLFQTL